MIDAGLLDTGSDKTAQFEFSFDTTKLTTGTLTGAGCADIDIYGTLDVGLHATFNIDQVKINAGALFFAQSVSHTITAGQYWSLETATISGGGKNTITNDGTFSTADQPSSGGDNARSTVSVGFTNNTTVVDSYSPLSFLGPITNNGTIMVEDGGHLTVSHFLAGTGTIDIRASPGRPPFAVVELHAIAASQTIDFMSAAGTLLLDSPGIGGTPHITGFVAGDVISLANIHETGFTFNNHILAIQDGTETVAQLHIAGAANTAQSFTISNSSSGDVLITHT